MTKDPLHQQYLHPSWPILLAFAAGAAVDSMWPIGRLVLGSLVLLLIGWLAVRVAIAA